MAEFTVARVSVKVVPDADGFHKDLAKQTAKIRPIEVKVQPKVDNAGLADLNRQLAGVNGRTVTAKANVDITQARTAIAAVNQQLSSVNGRTATARVNADVAQARTALAAVDRQLAGINGKSVRATVNVDTDRARSGIAAVGSAASNVGSSVSGLGSVATSTFGQMAAGAARAAGSMALMAPVAVVAGGAIVAAAGAAAAALAAIPAGAAIAVGGIATLGFAFSGVGDAVKALGDADTQSASASSSAAQQRQAAMQRVKSAVRSLSDAQTNADRTAIQGRERVRSAELALQAAQRQAQAAQESLNRAREEAREAVEDLALSLRGAVLSEERASLSLEQAQLRLNEAIAAGEPALQIRDYELAVREASLSVDEARERTGDLRQESAEWARTGIEGSAGVVAAQRQVQDANLAVAEAQRNIGVAVREAGWANADAQKQVARAVDELRMAHEAQGTAGVAAADKVAEAMAKLSPAGRQFAQFLHNELMPAMDRVKFAAQEGLLPGLENSLRRMIPLAPIVADGVFGIGQSLAGLAGRITDVFTSAEGQDAIRNAMAGTAEFIDRIGPGIQRVVGAAMRIVGMRELYTIFGDIVGGLAERFGQFLDKMRESGLLTRGMEILRDVTLSLGDAFFRFLELSAEFFVAAGPGLKAFAAQVKPIMEMLDWKLLGESFGMLLQMIGPVIKAIVLGLYGLHLAWRGIMEALQFLWNSIGKPVFDGMVWLVQNVIGPAMMFLWHNVMVPAWNAIGAAIGFVWNTFIKPAWDAMVWLVRDVLAPAILWFWHAVIVPAFNAIGAVISFVFNTFIKPIFDAWAWVIREVIVPIIQWLWHNVVSPIFTWIGDKIQAAWNAFIRPAFDGIKLGFEAVGGAIRWVWDNVFSPVFTWIGDKVQAAWNNFIRPAFDGISGAFQAVGDWIMRVWNEKIKPVIDWMVEGFDRAKRKVEEVIPGGSDGSRPPEGRAQGGLVGYARGGQVLGFQRGGRAPGPTDTVPSMLTPREFVMTRLATANLGPNIMYQLMGLLERNPQVANLLAQIIKTLSAGGAAAGLGAMLSQHAGAAGFGGVGTALGFARGGLVQGFQAGGAVGAPAPAAGAAPAEGAATPGIDPAQMQAAAAASELLNASLTLLNTTIALLTVTVTTFITTALTPLQVTIMTLTIPAIMALQNQMFLVQTVTIPQLTLAFQLFLQQMILIWQQIVLLITNSVMLMSQQFTLLQTNNQLAWNNIVLHTQNSVNTITGPIFGALIAGMDNIRLQAQQTAEFWGQQMDSMRAKAADPVRWIMLFPLGPPGIAASWNTLDDQFKLGKRINPPAPNFATGGRVHGPGTGTSDSITARLSDGEYVVRQKIASRHHHFLDALNAGQPEAVQAAGGRQARMPGYAEGGIIAAVERAKQWAQGQAGKRYVWAGVGPGGYDCSGWMSAITNVLRGQYPHRRVGATGNFPWAGFAPGLGGSFAIGSRTGSPGHMAGTLGGVNVESGGSHNTNAYGGPAIGADNPKFTTRAFLREIGGVFASGGAGGGGGFDPTPVVDAAFKKAYDLHNDIVKHFGDSPYVLGLQNITKQAIDAVRQKALDQLMAMFGGGTMGGVGAGAPFHVAEISRVARERGLGRDGAVIGVATGLVESGLRNLGSNKYPESRTMPGVEGMGSDHDSVGVFQQRPSMGWGTVAQCMNTGYAAGAFFSRFPGNWRSMDPGAVAQGVQRSAYPGKYGPRMGQASQLVTAHGGPFDDGGIARGMGWMYKATDRDERVLAPMETRSYDTLTHLIGRSGIKVQGADDPASAPGNTINVYPREHHSEQAIAAMVDRRTTFEQRIRG